MSVMGRSTNKDINHVLGRKYNVEYFDGRGRCQTFNNTLINVDGTYFWFSSEENGMALVRQDRVTFMYCTDKPRFKDGENPNPNLVFTIVYGYQNENQLQNEISLAVDKGYHSIQIYIPSNRIEYFECHISKEKIHFRKGVEVATYNGCNVIFDS